MIDEELLKIIACPKCKGDIEYIKGDVVTEKEKKLTTI